MYYTDTESSIIIVTTCYVYNYVVVKFIVSLINFYKDMSYNLMRYKNFLK
jgi:hypothetical protein